MLAPFIVSTVAFPEIQKRLAGNSKCILTIWFKTKFDKLARGTPPSRLGPPNNTKPPLTNQVPLQPWKIRNTMTLYFPTAVLLARQGSTQEKTGEGYSSRTIKWIRVVSLKVLTRYPAQQISNLPVSKQTWGPGGPDMKSMRSYVRPFSVGIAY